MQFAPTENPDWRLVYRSPSRPTFIDDWLCVGAFGWLSADSSSDPTTYNFQIHGDAQLAIQLNLFVVASSATRVTLVVENQIVLETLLTADSVTKLQATHSPAQLEGNAGTRSGTLIIEPVGNPDFHKFFLFLDNTQPSNCIPVGGMQPQVKLVPFGAKYQRRRVARLLAVALFLVLFVITMEINAVGQRNVALISSLAIFFALVVRYLPRIVDEWATDGLKGYVVDRVSASRLARYSLVILVFCLAGYGSLIIRCMITSDLYREDVRNLIFSENVQHAIHAFEAYPNRSEIYLAIGHLLSRKRSDIATKQAFAEDFITGIDFRNYDGGDSRLTQTLRSICPCTIGETVDPLLAVALIAPDATPRPTHQSDGIPRDRHYTGLAQQKITALRQDSWQARVYAYILHGTLVSDGLSALPFTDKQEKEYLASFEELISERPSAVTSHLFQEALSQMASYPLARCLGGTTPSRDEITASIEKFKVLLRMREHTHSDLPQWTRSPAKMTLYALFMTFYGLPLGKEMDYSDPLAGPPFSCISFVNAFRAEFDQDKYNGWKNASAWYSGTIYDPAYRGRAGFWAHIEQSLRQGWKY